MGPCLFLKSSNQCMWKLFVRYLIAVSLINLLHSEFLINQIPIDQVLKSFQNFQRLQYEFQCINFSSHSSDIHRMQRVAMMSFKQFIMNSAHFGNLIDRFN